MAQIRPKGDVRYLLLAIIPQSLSKGFEAMGDRAVEQAGQGNGAGVPYYLAALALTLIALGLCLFALKRFYDRITGKGENGSETGPAAQKVTALGETFSDTNTFDPDAVMQRYLENRPSTPPANPTPARPSGFGKKGL